MPGSPMTDSGTEPEDDSGTEVQCTNCGYVWIYTGTAWRATCPNCNRKTITPFDPDYEAEDDETEDDET